MEKYGADPKELQRAELAQLRVELGRQRAALEKTAEVQAEISRLEEREQALLEALGDQ